jgi:hypothetical protein
MVITGQSARSGNSQAQRILSVVSHSCGVMPVAGWNEARK